MFSLLNGGSAPRTINYSGGRHVDIDDTTSLSAIEALIQTLKNTGDADDAILADDSILYGFVLDNKGYKILPARYTKEYYAIALRQGEENKELKEELNKILNHMQQTGKLNRIKEKWIPNLHKGA